jgi:Leucine-rich repeat (LRR) protein
MPEATPDKHQILLAGGTYDDEVDQVTTWLDFLTNPRNLRPGLPSLTVYFGFDRFMTVEVSFDESRPSLRSLKLDLDFAGYERSFFQETDPSKLTMAADRANNPHHWRDWIFGIFQQTELEELDVLFVNTELPDLFHQLTKLKKVFLRDSRIIRLPPSFFQLPALEILNLVQVDLPEVPAELSKIKSLRKLLISQPCTPSVLASLRGLTHLSCYSSNFDVPPEIAQLTNLKVLNLSSVSSAFDDFLNFPELEKLNLQVDKKITTFNFGEGNVPCLKELTTNYPVAFVSALANCKSLEKLSFSGKANESSIVIFKESIKDLIKLTHLSAVDFGVNEMQFCSSLTNLEYLDLSENEITVIPPSGNLKKLKTLKLIANRIFDIEGLPPGLEELDLSENEIVDLPLALGNLQKLKKLILNKNPFIKFPQLAVMPSITWLEFRDTGIPEGKDSSVAGVPEPEVLKRLAHIFPNAFLACDTDHQTQISYRKKNAGINR